MRSALRLARVDSGWIASPASLTNGLGQLRAFGDEAVERSAGQLALELEELGRRLRLGEGLHGVRSLLDAFTAAWRRRPGRSCGRRRRRCGRLRRAPRHWPWLSSVEFLSGLLRLASDFLAALAGIGEQGLELVGAGRASKPANSCWCSFVMVWILSCGGGALRQPAAFAARRGFARRAVFAAERAALAAAWLARAAFAVARLEVFAATAGTSFATSPAASIAFAATSALVSIAVLVSSAIVDFLLLCSAT